MSIKRNPNDDLALFELIEPRAGQWTYHRVDIRESAVDTTNREAWLPAPHTPAQRLARMHEAGHAKYSPSSYQEEGDWPEHFLAVTRMAMADKGVSLDPNALQRISKMLEENRIDWLLWDRHEIDLRPGREVLDWSLWPDPDSLLDALCTCLQLAWTVWASRGLSRNVLNLPPTRSPDPATGETFDKHWKYLTDTKRELGVAMIFGCLAMYENPTNLRRNEVAAELATFFPVEIKQKEEQPQPKQEEREAQEKGDREERERAAYEQEGETGAGAEVKLLGQIEYHDHTTALRHKTVRIRRKMTPTSQGVDARFAHRYLLDKAIFAERRTTEGGLMIDGSGSMQWTNADMALLVEVLPAIRVGVYVGRGSDLARWDQKPVYGRICTIAKNGLFARYEGLDPGSNGMNDVDFEALQLLATWPKPRFWLSDGIVCGGKYSSKPAEHHEPVGYYAQYGLLHEMCDAFMRRHEILRVPDRETMHKLLKRQRVTLYRNCSNRGLPGRYGHEAWWPESAPPLPTTFSL